MEYEDQRGVYKNLSRRALHFFLYRELGSHPLGHDNYRFHWVEERDWAPIAPPPMLTVRLQLWFQIVQKAREAFLCSLHELIFITRMIFNENIFMSSSYSTVLWVPLYNKDWEGGRVVVQNTELLKFYILTVCENSSSSIYGILRYFTPFLILCHNWFHYFLIESFHIKY